MKLDVQKVGSFEIKDITYKEARELHIKNTLIFWGKKEEDIDPAKYYKFLEEVKELSGLTDETLSKYSMVQVDLILQQVLMEYTGLNPKK